MLHDPVAAPQFGGKKVAGDMDMLAGVEMMQPKDVPAAVAMGIVADQKDTFPDPMSASLDDAWKKDHKALERQLATM